MKIFTPVQQKKRLPTLAITIKPFTMLVNWVGVLTQQGQLSEQNVFDEGNDYIPYAQRIVLERTAIRTIINDIQNESLSV